MRTDFEALTCPQLGALYRFAVRNMKDADTAQDLVQDACLKAYRAFDRFQPGTNYKAWLFRILINTMLDWQRRAGRRPIEVALDLATLEASTFTPRIGADPERALAGRSLAAAVQDALDALPPPWQAVVHLSFVEGFSYKEIADILACPVGTVMSRLSRARQALRGRLAHHLDDSGLWQREAAGAAAAAKHRP